MKPLALVAFVITGCAGSGPADCCFGECSLYETSHGQRGPRLPTVIATSRCTSSDIAVTVEWGIPSNVDLCGAFERVVAQLPPATLRTMASRRLELRLHLERVTTHPVSCGIWLDARSTSGHDGAFDASTKYLSGPQSIERCIEKLTRPRRAPRVDVSSADFRDQVIPDVDILFRTAHARIHSTTHRAMVRPTSEVDAEKLERGKPMT